MKERQEWRGHYWRSWEGRHSARWRRKRGVIFVRFMAVFGLVVLLVLGGMAALAFFFTGLAGGNRGTAVLVLLSSCGLAIALPLLAASLAARAFRGIAVPLADVMEAADAVAEGDFSVRVAERGRGNQFTGLARSFNRMAAELERSDALRRNLTADVAHELRTPLHIIRGNLEGVLDGVYAPTSEHVAATLEETATLSRLVDDLLILSQAEAGQLPLQMESVDIADLLADVQTSFGGLAAEKQIDLQVRIDGRPERLVVTGDALRLDQALSNLVVNALQHTPPGGRVRLQAGRQDGLLRLEVADTGEGILTEDLPFVFDRFWRGDPARSRSGGAGAGLGLAIAKQLVEAHQGTISVDSAPGQGAQFVILLPAAAGAPA
jgi:signal transduction histidine kinase